MRRLAIIFTLAPWILSAQNNKPIANFYLENNTIIYRHIFNDSIDSASVIIQKLLMQIPASPNINNVKEFNKGALITGSYELQSATEGSPWEMLKGYFIIEIKNGKYRVTISNILDNKNMGTIPFTYLYAKNKPLEWRSTVQHDLEKLDSKFTTQFELIANSSKKDW